MAPVNIKYIVSFSSQDDCHKANNLVTSDGSKVWLSNRKDVSGKCEVVLQLEKPSQIAYLDIGAVWCAALEIRVGRSDWPQTIEFKPLIATFMLMSPLDCRLSRGFKSTQMFSKKDFSQEVSCELWDRLHIICRQPYRRDVQLGLSFIHIRDASSTVPPGNPSAPTSGVSPLDKPGIGVSPLRKSGGIDASSIQKHFFGDGNKASDDSPTDRLKYRLMKMAGSTENGCEQEQALSRTAKLVLKASENQKSCSPRQTSSAVPRKGLFSEHVAKKNDVPVAEEMKRFLPTLNVTAADIDKVTIADLRHKLERRKRRKLTKEERHTFSEICQDFFYDLFDTNNEPVDCEKPGSVLGPKVQSDLPETNTINDKLSKEPVKGRSDGKTHKTPNIKRTSQVNKAGQLCHKDLTALSTTAGMNCYGKPESATLNNFSSQDGWIKSPALRTSVKEKVVVNESTIKTLSSSSVGDNQISAGEKHKVKIHNLVATSSGDLTSHPQKLSLKTPFSSPRQNLPMKRKKQTVSKGHTRTDENAGSDSTSSLSYDSDCNSVHEADKPESSSLCSSPGRKILTTEDLNKSYKNVYSHTDQHKTPVSIKSSKPAKLKRLSKASFDIFQEFSMEIMNSSDNESTSKTDDDDRKMHSLASNRDSLQRESKTEVNSQLDSSVNNSNIAVNMISANGTPKKLKTQSNGTEPTTKTPNSVKGKIYRMHTSRNKLNISQTRKNLNLEHNNKVSETLPGSTDVDRLDRLVNQNCLEYRGSRNKDIYVTSPDKMSRHQAVDMNVRLSIPTSHSSDMSSQSSRTRWQKSNDHSSRRTTSKPSTLLPQDTAVCENCYGQYPADVIPTHRVFCTAVRQGAAASPDEMSIDETVDCAECPICLQRFPQDVLLVHASECGV